MVKRKYGLIGFPLGHSFSVPYFTGKFRDQQIQAIYNNYPMEEVSGLIELVAREELLAGLNVTVPHKQSVIPLLDDLDPVSASLGAVNTIVIRRDGGEVYLRGYNTDVIGFKRSLNEHLQPHHDRALILGTGGSSRAVMHVLRELNIPFQLVSRQGRSGVLTYGNVSQQVLRSTKLVINTTPLGMYPLVDDCPPLPYEVLSPEHLLFDLVYNPSMTLFLKHGEKRGAHVANGYDMLVYQAEASWEIWNANDT
jgi:shikimate dehydrogenase